MADLIKNGFFLMDDGTKSSDYTAKPVKKACKPVKSNGETPTKSQDTVSQNSKKSVSPQKKTKK